ncbi:MAG: helix-turn-helix domain-containing protein, partial [Planctomycetota bacterium]
LISRDDAAATLGVAVETFDRQRRAGKTPAPVKIGGRLLFRRADLDAWVGMGCPDRAEFEARTADLSDSKPSPRRRR